MKRIVILISGRGSNLRAVAEACAEQRWPACIAAVVASRADAAGLQYAAEQGYATAVVDPRDHPERSAFDTELARAVDTFEPDLVLLAGFMRILGDRFVQEHAGRMLNVHPSLLPAFPGLHTHRRVLAAGCKVAGATVHFVTPEVDHGPIVIQAAVPVRPGDDEAALAARVLGVEHVIYPLAARWFVEGRLRVVDGIVEQLDGASQVLM